MVQIESGDRPERFVQQKYAERLVDLGEIRMNYIRQGEGPPLLLIGGQAESWWGYTPVISLLAEHFTVHAVDLRGQGRSTWTPGRYTLDNFGNDLVRFIDQVIGEPTFVSGLSSGGVLSAWLAAYAKPSQIRAAVLEDPPLFSSEVLPAVAPGINSAMGPVFANWHKWLGNQWSRGDWKGAQQAFPQEIPLPLLQAIAKMVPVGDGDAEQAPQNLREYDPEWASAFVSGSATAACDHSTMLSNVKVPVLLTHHFHETDAQSGHLIGALSDEQAARARHLVEAAGQTFDYQAFPEMPHAMHSAAPDLYTETLLKFFSAR